MCCWSEHDMVQFKGCPKALCFPFLSVFLFLLYTHTHTRMCVYTYVYAHAYTGVPIHRDMCAKHRTQGACFDLLLLLANSLLGNLAVHRREYQLNEASLPSMERIMKFQIRVDFWKWEHWELWATVKCISAELPKNKVVDNNLFIKTKVNASNELEATVGQVRRKNTAHLPPPFTHSSCFLSKVLLPWGLY